ncbi:restriction endonuclease subunit S [Chitinilyticum piscinae]|uniref:Restriction endonuclease subunit S n=1 Tax=Chitinilyticum piscinae TaxID=2866724 RepID=A0A8J7KGZ9_9NEIS|nr:restriction endonuclease subunit S [Chitinilyticum piscinae]MBE9610929.1 restriction endonuclease subunit S [Chitinilyticum piscinae]
MKAWPVVPLADVLQHRKEFITIDDTQHYKRCRVQLHAKGVLLRDTVSGADIKTKKQQVCRAGEFLVAEIDAKMGGFGLVPAELDGAVVSSHYFLFEIDESCLDVRYLDHYCRTERFRKQVEAQGSTNYAAIRPADVLAYTIPLPALPKQQALVARLDALAGKTRQVEAHLEAALRDAEHLLALRFRDAIAGAPLRPMAEVAPSIRRPVEIDIDTRYREVGARSFGKGLFIKPDFDGAEATWQKPVWIKSGDLVLSNIKAWEGAIAIADEQHDGCIASHRYITCVPDPELATVGFLVYYLLSEDGLEKVGLASPGTADRNRTLSLGNLGKIEVPTPPLAVQHTFDRLQAAVAALKARHAAIREANAALLPALLARLFAHGCD